MTLLSEELILAAKLPNHIPTNRNGKKRHKSAIYRAISRGVRGVRLEAVKLPDGWYTSVQAWQRFVLNLTTAALRKPALHAEARSRQQAKRQTAVETEIAAVRASLGKRQRKGGQDG